MKQVESMLIELKEFIEKKKSQGVEVETIHAYVCDYEAENDSEVDVYYVNVKACYSFGEQETFNDGLTFEKLEECQSHISYVSNELIEKGYGELLLVDIEAS